MSKINKDLIQPGVTLEDKGGQKYLLFSGQWLTLAIEYIRPKLLEIKLSESQTKNLIIDFDHNFTSDMAGSWTIAKFLETFKLSEAHKKNIPDEILNLIHKSFKFPPKQPDFGAELILAEIGKSAIDLGENSKKITEFWGETLVNFCQLTKQKKELRWSSIAYFIDMVGIRAIPIIALISLLIGAVLAYQGVTQLEKFGASTYTVDFLAISLLREISVLLTSIVVAGRSGSSFTAQIGTMALNQEIDAIRMMGLNPFHVLVIPRVIALVISLPLLVLLSIIMGCIGGMIVVENNVGIPYGEFWLLFQNAVSKTTFWTGMSKAPLFALIIGVIGCFRGMQVKGSAESVGIMTTRSVVESIFMVIICDAVMSIFFTSMDW